MKATVTVEGKKGAVRIPATRGSDGTWFAPVKLGPHDRAFVDVGGVVDANSEINGQRSAVVSRR